MLTNFQQGLQTAILIMQSHNEAVKITSKKHQPEKEKDREMLNLMVQEIMNTNEALIGLMKDAQFLSPPDNSQRQAKILDWAKRCFGERVATNRAERAMRVLEEALELAQAEGVDIKHANLMMHHVYQKPVGKTAHEVAGVSVALEALAENLNLNVSGLTSIEVERITNVDPNHFRKRQMIKENAGVAVIK